MARRRTNKNPRALRYVSNTVKGVGNVIQYGVGGIVRGTEKVVGYGMNQGDRAIGATGRFVFGKGKGRRTRRKARR